MSKEMIVSVNGREKKIAILDNGKVTEFYIERGEENSGVAGNVYKGRVMRVLPGMQSAFVDIGLERDAFLYVSDFFDEEEEIERIVMEKGKKTTPEDAKREANEQIERSRMEREKQMESVQGLAEPLAESPAGSIDTLDEILPPAGAEEKPRRGRGRGKKPVEADETSGVDASDQPQDGGGFVELPPIELDLDNSGFERIADDDSDTGEMFKDAYMQEAIVDRVRAIEFDMESTSMAEVGSLFDQVGDTGGFERIADEDSEPAGEAPKKRGRAAKSPSEKKSAKAKTPKAEKVEKEKKPTKPRAARGKKVTSDEEPLADAEARVRETEPMAEMAVRRGGRGRRRGGPKPKQTRESDGSNGNGDEHGELDDAVSTDDGAESVEMEMAETADAVEVTVSSEVEPAELVGVGDEPAAAERADTRRESRPRGRGGRDRERPDRDRPERSENRDRPERAENRDRPERSDNRDRERSDRDRPNRGERPERSNGRGDRRDRPPQPAISDLLKEGQEILVQIAKEPIAKKGARITSHIALPGRYLVYMPTIEHLGVSRKIESSNERGRLRQLIQRIRQDKDIPSGGFIVRTAGIGISEEDLKTDAKYLVKTWVEAKKGSEKKKSPAMIHQDLDLVQRLLRDQLSGDFASIRVDSEEEYLRTVEFVNLIAPKMVNRVKLYTRDEPILDYYNVQEEIDKALKPRVWLKSGGYLVINQTEALVAIDVNTGKFVGKGNARLEDTITRTNMEAVDEIARQIRLRDLGGIIVLDLIDMEDRRNRHKVSQALQEALQHDKSPTKVLSFNDFGLIIMTRKRVKQSLERTMCAPCDYCEGAGWVKSPTTTCYEILAEARRLSKHLDDVRNTTLRVHPDVSIALRGPEREVLEEIEAYLGNVDITADRSIHQAQFDFAFV